MYESGWRCSSAVPCSTIAGGTTGSIVTGIAGVGGTGPLGDVNSAVPHGAIVGGPTGSVAADIAGRWH